MADRAHLQLVENLCPPSQRACVEREMEVRLNRMGVELTQLTRAAEGIEDAELAGVVSEAWWAVTKARLALAERRAGR